MLSRKFFIKKFVIYQISLIHSFTVWYVKNYMWANTQERCELNLPLIKMSSQIFSFIIHRCCRHLTECVCCTKFIVKLKSLSFKIETFIDWYRRRKRRGGNKLIACSWLPYNKKENRKLIILHAYFSAFTRIMEEKLEESIK